MAFGSGLANFFRTTAGSFGASLVTTFWQRREALHRTHLVESITSYSPHAASAMTQLHDAGLSGAQSMGQINAALTHQSTLLAATDLFWLSGWLFLLLMMSVWFAKRPTGGAPVGAH
jgi:DHA2 family multidrug resistance protein